MAGSVLDDPVSIDWDALVYASVVPPSLFCSVCKNVLLTPLQTSCKHNHIFCARCISRALEDIPQCPVDRIPLPNGLEDCSPVPRILNQVLDDLEIHCPNEECNRVISRATLEIHLKTDCRFQLTKCPDFNCNGFVFRHENDGETCSHASAICEHCQREVMERDRVAHLDECFELSHKCADCNEEFSASDLKLHRDFCRKKPVTCTAAGLGCQWAGTRGNFRDHLDACALETLRPWLEQLQTRVQNLDLENRLLKQNLDLIAAEKSMESVLEISSEYERDRKYLFETLETHSKGLDALSASVTALDSKHNHISMTESIRSKEEIAMLRGGLQSLRLQWHHFIQNTRGFVGQSTSTAEEYREPRVGRSDVSRVSPTRAPTSDESRVKL